MGLIQAALFAGRKVLADQWREYFYCDSLDAEVMVVKGQKRAAAGSSNHKGTDNVITNGSIIAVADGQCMMIVEQGKVVEICAEPGEFVYDSSTEPTVLYGGFGEGLLESFKTFGKRFTFGGDAAKDQRVYYFNTKELVGNKYGTPNPVPFRVVDPRAGIDIDISLRCSGEYSFHICNPLLFYTNVCGNVTESYTRTQLEGQLKSELLTALQPAFAKISAMGIRYSALPAHTVELADALNEVLSEKWRELRGLEIVSFGMSTLKASAEDEAMLKEMQKNAAFVDPSLAAAHLVGAQAEAMKSAAKNENAGSAMAFMGMNLAGKAGGVNAQQLYQMGMDQKQEVQQASANAAAWQCGCGNAASGNFCSECGAKRPQPMGWTCTCGHVNKGNFCSECGSKKPDGTPKYKCDKCGWEPADPTKPPKFCPQCGDAFTSSDIR